MRNRFIALKPFNNKVFYKNGVFNEHSETGSSYLIAARKLLAKKNILMNTIDIAPQKPTYKDIYTDVPYPWNLKLWLRIIKNSRKSILFIVEPPIVNPFNHMKLFHLFFSKVYTWNEDFVDNRKYFKYYIPNKTAGIKIKQIPFKNKKLLIMMNANWLPFLPFKLLSLPTKELYTERVKAINFFDTHYPNNFYLYGKGWNKPPRFSIRQKPLGSKKYKTYKGSFLSKDKYKILSKFKFCLCFENCEIKGNISEKIIDCFKAKCVPVYWGAPDVKEYIPESCFIDFTKFKSLNELFIYLKNMEEAEYNIYIQNIQKLLQDKRFKDRWFENGFAQIFLQSLTAND